MRTQLLLAFRILKRHKFFTFVSLFGISFTIMMLVVLTAFVDASIGANAPMSKRDRLVFATRFTSIESVPDTTYGPDSVIVIGSRRESYRNGYLGLKLIDNHLRDLPGVKQMSVSTTGKKTDIYLEDKQFSVSSNYTDAAFWSIYDFKFLSGHGFSEQDLTSGAKRVVLSRRAAELYFGFPISKGVNKTILLGGQHYEVVGIVDQVSQANPGLAADVFLPYTIAPQADDAAATYHGDYSAVFEVDTPQDRGQLTAHIGDIADNLQALPGENYNLFILEALTAPQEFASGFIPFAENRKRALNYLITASSLAVGIITLLPALNLINVNLGRVFERASEIAVRKSFGASRFDIVRQFLVESLLITVIGALIGSLLALVIIQVLNYSSWLDNVTLAFTPAVALWTLAIALVFSLLTGVLPAFRMAQTHISTSLR